MVEGVIARDGSGRSDDRSFHIRFIFLHLVKRTEPFLDLERGSLLETAAIWWY